MKQTLQFIVKLSLKYIQPYLLLAKNNLILNPCNEKQRLKQMLLASYQ